ncbi:uncharacterized protein LOC110704291 [Chenopodium quinoa]|uniref:uncharacterized protein LOC110704291 n=1 Tax=Chenopodium quinoa TaxID=63459 RepID=UPI000B78ED99|nr:uncharacterized protein LOC110704291 [Chenopodium quinoa]
MESEREKSLSSEENDLLQQSNRKFKRNFHEKLNEDNSIQGNGENEVDLVTDDDTPIEEDSDEEGCPTIYLTKEEKRRLRRPWKDALIIKLFDKRLSYEVLDYEYVLTKGPWMIGDSYLTIRKWKPNVIFDEEPIKKLTAWVRIPQLSVEYFDKQFLFKIGSKIGKVIKIDRNTESKYCGQYVRFCIEVNLTKPLLSKFRLNWRGYGVSSTKGSK